MTVVRTDRKGSQNNTNEKKARKRERNTNNPKQRGGRLILWVRDRQRSIQKCRVKFGIFHVSGIHVVAILI